MLKLVSTEVLQGLALLMCSEQKQYSDPAS